MRLDRSTDNQKRRPRVKLRAASSGRKEDKMHPLSIIISFAFLGMLVIVGTQLSVLSFRKLQSEVVPVASVQRTKASVKVSVSGALLALGLLLVAVGVRGVYRLLWVG